MPYKIEIVQGDITRSNCQAIVNAANNEFWMGSGVAGAIKAAGGEAIEQEAMNKGPVIPGEAVLTGGGKLAVKYIIHAAVMGQDLKTNDKLIRRATIASLQLAETHQIESIAFPAFGTGVGGFPMPACAYIMTTAARSFQPISKIIRRVQFCLYDSYGYECFRKKIEGLD